MWNATGSSFRPDPLGLHPETLGDLFGGQETVHGLHPDAGETSVAAGINRRALSPRIVATSTDPRIVVMLDARMQQRSSLALGFCSSEGGVREDGIDAGLVADIRRKGSEIAA
jgi:hypothetical protein